MKPLARYDALDSLRGLCACMVVLYHFKPNSHFLHAGLIRHANLFVDFFFVLSGFVIFEAYRDKLRAGFGLKRFIVLRLGRIYPLHIFLLFLFVAYEIVWAVWLSRYSAQPRAAFSGANSVPALFANILMLQSFGFLQGTSWNYPAWSIGAEFWTYILFACAIIRCPPQSLDKLLWFLALAGLTASLAIASNFRGDADANGFPRCVYGFALGGLLSCHRDLISLGGWRATLAEAVAALLSVVFVSLADGPVAMMAPPIFALTIAAFAPQRGWISRRLLLSQPFATLGRLSYSIYMVHVLVILLATNLVSVAEKLLGHPLRSTVSIGDTEISAIGLTFYQGDFAYLALLGAVVLVAAQTFRFVEEPWREYSRELASNARSLQPARAHPET